MSDPKDDAEDQEVEGREEDAGAPESEAEKKPVSKAGFGIGCVAVVALILFVAYVFMMRHYAKKLDDAVAMYDANKPEEAARELQKLPQSGLWGKLGANVRETLRNCYMEMAHKERRRSIEAEKKADQDQHLVNAIELLKKARAVGGPTAAIQYRIQ